MSDQYYEAQDQDTVSSPAALSPHDGSDESSRAERDDIASQQPSSENPQDDRGTFSREQAAVTDTSSRTEHPTLTGDPSIQPDSSDRLGGLPAASRPDAPGQAINTAGSSQVYAGSTNSSDSSSLATRTDQTTPAGSSDHDKVSPGEPAQDNATSVDAATRAERGDLNGVAQCAARNPGDSVWLPNGEIGRVNPDGSISWIDRDGVTHTIDPKTGADISGGGNSDTIRFSDDKSPGLGKDPGPKTPSGPKTQDQTPRKQEAPKEEGKPVVLPEITIYGNPSEQSLAEKATTFVEGLGEGAWQGAKSTAEGLYNLVCHPVRTGEGVYQAVTHPISTVEAIGKELKDFGSAVASGDPRAIGRAGFEVASFLIPVSKVGTASKVVEAAAGIAKGAEVAEAAVAAAKTAEGAKTAALEHVQDARAFYPLHRGEVGTLVSEGRQPMHIKSGFDCGPWGGTQRGGIPRGKGEVFTSGAPHEGNIATHVEGHAAAIMRQQNINKATLYMGREQCDICSKHLSIVLPPGSELTVVHVDEAGNLSRTIYRSNQSH